MKNYLFMLTIKGDTTWRIISQVDDLDAAKTVLYDSIPPEDTCILQVFETTAPISRVA